MVYHGTFKNGVVILDEPAAIPEGQRVMVEPEVKVGNTTQRLLKMAGVLKDGPADASVNHDHYLYGSPKRKSE